MNTDDRDTRDLTDGQFGERSDEKIWFEKGAVGWQGTPLITIFADLGQPQPIASVVARFLGGAEQGSLNFPNEVRVLLSLDGKDYYRVAAQQAALGAGLRPRRTTDRRSPVISETFGQPGGSVGRPATVAGHAAQHRAGLDDLSADAYDLPEEKLAWVHNFALPVQRKARYVAVQSLPSRAVLLQRRDRRGQGCR